MVLSVVVLKTSKFINRSVCKGEDSKAVLSGYHQREQAIYIDVVRSNVSLAY